MIAQRVGGRPTRELAGWLGGQARELAGWLGKLASWPVEPSGRSSGCPA